MLSSIGEASLLSSFGIETIVDLPDVGQNLQVRETAISVIDTCNSIPTAGSSSYNVFIHRQLDKYP